MLPSLHRLQKTKDINRVFHAGHPIKKNSLLIRKAKNELAYTGMGFVVSKQVSKKAVERNRMRRVLREAVRKNGEAVQQGWDVVITVTPGFLAQGGSIAEERIMEALKQARVTS